MAFNRKNFSPAGGQSMRGHAPQLWTYKSADTVAAVNTAGYFNDVSDLLTVGDNIYAYLDTGGAPQAYNLTVNANSGGVVDITDGLAVGTTDTD